MSQRTASGSPVSRRYNWCPSCDELWLAARMKAAGVDSCPACDGPVLAYIGRSPYDLGRPSANERPEQAGPAGAANMEGSAPRRSSSA